MKYREDKKFVDLIAKTVLLENELEEAIEAQDRLRMAEHEHGLDKSFKYKVTGFLILFGVVIAWIAYQQFRETTTRVLS